ncbi:MAG: XdhC family protein [Gemmatimonadetes bacterium]|nr:XdhC family protein [Gemmatimonadota bacterium]
MAWQETKRIYEMAQRCGDRGQRSAVATVVRIEGSAYRRPGAKLLIDEDGTMAGNVSGGCLETDLREVALTAIKRQESELRHYETGTDEETMWGLGLGCGGSVDVFVHPFTPDDENQLVRPLLKLLSGSQRFVVATVIEPETELGATLIVVDEKLTAGSTDSPRHDAAIAAAARNTLEQERSTVQEIDSLRVFTEVFIPPPELVICGAGDDAIPLATYASDQGFRVTIADHRSAYLESDRFPTADNLVQMRPEDGGELPSSENTYVVIMFHHLEHDGAWLARFAGSHVSYIGILGPRARTEKMMADAGVTDNSRIHAPVGLDVGAEGPEQVALSIMAEILAIRSGHTPTHLRDKDGPIHDI